MKLMAEKKQPHKITVQPAVETDTAAPLRASQERPDPRSGYDPTAEAVEAAVMTASPIEVRARA